MAPQPQRQGADGARPFNLLVGFNYPCPIHPRVCSTQYGLCRLGTGIRPGTPCQCWASSNGLWYPGVCIR